MTPSRGGSGEQTAGHRRRGTRAGPRAGGRDRRGQGLGNGVHPHPAPVLARVTAGRRVDGESPQERHSPAGRAAAQGRHRDRHARVDERLLAYLVLRPGGVRAGGAAGAGVPGQEPARAAQDRQAGCDVAGPADRDGPAAARLRAAEGDPGPARLHPGPDQAGPRAHPLLAAAGKTAEGALIKLSSVASKLTTLSAQDMIKAMIAGQRDPRTLAALARRTMKAKHDALVEALDGMFDDHHGELAQLLLDQIASLDAKIVHLSARIAELTAAMPAGWGVNADGSTGPDAGTGPDAPVLNAVARLAEIPGISPDLARSIIAETGLDMGRFPTAAHLVSWAGLCPAARQSGPRTRAGKKGQGNGYLRGSLGQAALATARTQTFLGERYWRIARRRGKAKAQVAVARSILVIIWHL